MRPIVELAFVDFIGVCYNAIVNLAAKHYYLSNGQVKVPMVLMLGLVAVTAMRTAFPEPSGELSAYAGVSRSYTI